MLTTSFPDVYAASAYFLPIVGCTMLLRNWRKTDFEMELDENHIIGTAIIPSLSVCLVTSPN